MKLNEYTDEQLVIEFRRRHPACILGYKSTDKLNPDIKITIGSDHRMSHVVAQSAAAAAQVMQEQLAEEEMMAMDEQPIEALNEDEDDDDDD